MIFPSDEQFSSDARRELLENILPFWRERAVDPAGGFIAEMSNDLRLKPEAAKGLILNARLLWTFSAAYRFAKNADDQRLAHRAYDYITEKFLDRECGGYFWELDPRGVAIDDQKKIYGQAFAIYALSEYSRTFSSQEALRQAIDVFHHIETHAYDAQFGGYVEVLSRDWTPCENVRLSEKDMNEKKSMNNHLHVLEAYAGLLCAWPDRLPAIRLGELIELFDRRILDASRTHFHHFFDEAWNVKSDSYTFGHDIEGSWLLCEAAKTHEKFSPLPKGEGPGVRASNGKTLPENIRQLALQIAHATLREGLDPSGGLYYEGRGSKIVDRGKEWWPQAEAVVGFWNAWQISGESAFKEAAVRCWNFIQEKIVDRRRGEWFWRIGENGEPDDSLPKISAWKCPYHNARCCLEIIHRIESKTSPENRS
jgi:mannobiose 2-epimerase